MIKLEFSREGQLECVYAHFNGRPVDFDARQLSVNKEPIMLVKMQSKGSEVSLFCSPEQLIDLRDQLNKLELNAEPALAETSSADQTGQVGH